jgi:glycine/serine hydroxymethyltransferase
MKEPEMKAIGVMIDQVLNNSDDQGIRERVRRAVIELSKSFPLFTNLITSATK